MRFFVVGSLHLDVVVQAPHLPALDETVAGSGVAYLFGGKGGNQAVAAARMGASVSLAGRAGSDGFGDMIRSFLRTSGVEMSQLQLDEGPSGMSVAIVDANGDYGAVIVSAANLHIDTSQINLPIRTKLVLLQNEVPEKVNLDVARMARAAGARVWLNAAPAREISPELIALVDLLIVNRVEAEFYRGLPDDLQVLTTLGADGVCYAGQHFPGFPVDVVSTHGAGDMFVGALAARTVDRTISQDAIRFAQAAAAMFVSSAPEERSTLAEQHVVSFLAAHPGD